MLWSLLSNAVSSPNQGLTPNSFHISHQSWTSCCFSYHLRCIWRQRGSMVPPIKLSQCHLLVPFKLILCPNSGPVLPAVSQPITVVSDEIETLWSLISNASSAAYMVFSQTACMYQHQSWPPCSLLLNFTVSARKWTLVSPIRCGQCHLQGSLQAANIF